MAIVLTKKLKLLARLFGVALLGVLLYRTDLSALTAVLSSVKVALVGLSFFCCLLLIGIKSFRWKNMLAAQGMDYPFFLAYRSYLIGIFFGTVTPGRIGELFRAEDVKRFFKVSLGLGFSSVVGDRFLDLALLLVLGIIAVFHFNTAGGVWASLLPFLLGMVGLPILFFHPKVRSGLSLVAFRTVSKGLVGKAIAEGTREFYLGFKRLQSSRLVLWIGLTLAAYGLFFFAGYLLIMALEIDMGFGETSLVLAFAGLLALIPCTFAGVGTRDAVFIYIFSLKALDESQALAFSALVLAVFYLGTALAGFLCFVLNRTPKHA